MNPHLVSGLPFTLAERISLPAFGGCGCGCVCLWVGRVLHHFGMATFLVAVPTVTWLGKPWQFVPSMWPCIAQGAPLVAAIPIVFA